MKKKILLMLALVFMLACIFAISVSAETVYVNHNGEQVSADDADIAYELEIENPWDMGGNCKVKYIYLYDTSVTKIVIPAIELTHSNGTVYKLAEYTYLRLSTGWSGTLSVYDIDDKTTKSNSLHTQIKELEFHVPVYGDGASSVGNLAGWSGLEKLSFYNRACESQAKGGFLSGCTSIREIHFYGQNNLITGNFFPSSMVAGGIVVFHEDATGTINSCSMQSLNGKDVTIYLNTLIQPKDPSDPRLTWTKNNNGLLKFRLLVKDSSIYSDEEIKSYGTDWQAGDNKNANNAKYSMPIITYCEYYENHLSMTALSSCVSKCLACNELAIPENPVHNMDVAIKYTDYAVAGTKTTKCLNDSCPLNVEPSVEEVPALFVCLGYSAQGYGNGGILVGFGVNDTAISDYADVTGKNFKFGLFAGRDTKLGANDAVNTDGEALTGVASVDYTERDFDIVELKVIGFVTDEYKNANLALGLYVIDGDSVSYVQVSKPNDGEKYSYISYNSLIG